MKRHWHYNWSWIVAGGLIVAGCGNQTARAPNATVFEWPDRFTYRIDDVSEAQRDLKPVARYASTRLLRLAVRESQYVGGYDSVNKTVQLAGQPPREGTYLPEDTLSFYAKLGRHGEISGVTLGCDPAVPECAEGLPSTILVELRRIFPRLSEWEAPKGGSWVDTSAFDDADRPHGVRGSVTTTYSGHGDTTIGGRIYWMIGWHSVQETYHKGAGGTATLGAETPIELSGITLVDKRLLVPMLSTWAGAIAAPPEVRALGATAAGFRGRAYLAGSPFDSLYNPRP